MFLIVLLIILFLFRKCPNLLILVSRNVNLISVFAFGKIFQKTLKTWTGKIFICVILNVVLILVFDLFISKSSIMQMLLETSCLESRGRIPQIVFFVIISPKL